jgi:ferredoxin
MITIHYDGERDVREPEPGATLLEVSLRHHVAHLHECGGRGRCTTCRVRVVEGAANLTPREGREAELAQRREWDEGDAARVPGARPR